MKNDFFGEVDCTTLTQEIKDKALLLLMLMVEKCSSEMKMCGSSNTSYQRAFIGKNDFSSPVQDFCALKYVHAIISKEERHKANVDLSGFSIQTKTEVD